jgi:hypothetical protein
LADLYNPLVDYWALHPYFGPGQPARNNIAVTPSDTRDVTNPSGDNAPYYAKALYIGVTGNVAVVASGDKSNSGQGTPVIYVSVPVGWFPIQIRRVMATNTTATNIVGLYDQ